MIKVSPSLRSRAALALALTGTGLLSSTVLTACGEDASAESALEAAITASVQTGNAPLSVRLSAQHTGGLQSRYAYGWDFGDGEIAEGETEKEVEHVFTSAGTYAVQLEVREIGGPIGRATTTLEILGPADLLARDIAFEPRRVSPGATIQVLGGLGNDGASAVGAWTLRYVLSVDETVDPDDLVLLEQPRNGDPALPLETIDQTIDLPADLPSGTYYIAVVVDPDGSIGDSNRENNVAFGTFSLEVRNTTDQGPDLVVCGLSVPSFGLVEAGSATVQQGDQLEVEVCVGNTGNRPAIAADVVVVLSDDSTYEETDVVVFERTGLAIGAGETVREQVLVDVPADLSPGPWNFVAFTDTRNETDEQVEDNNERALAQPFEVVEPGAVEGVDLVVTAFETQGESAFWGQAVGSTIRVVNRGQTGVNRNFVLRVEAEPTDGRSAVQVASFNVPGLEAGGTLEFDDPITISRRVERGRYCLLATADPTNSAGDENPGNNRRRGACLELGGEPDLDLAVRGVTVSATDVAVEAQLTVRGVLQNLGQDPSGPFEAAVVFSPDAAFNPGDEIVHRFDVESLGDNENRDVEVSFAVPATLDRAVETWRVALVADPANRVTGEDSEENNAAFSPDEVTVTGAQGGCPEDEENEDDDAPNRARDLAPGESAALGLCDGADWGRVGLDALQGLEVRLVTEEAGARLVLGDEFGEALAPTDPTGPGEQGQVAFLPGGPARTVFVGVTGALDAAYGLSVTLVDAPATASLRPRAAVLVPNPAAPAGPLEVRVEVVNLGQADAPATELEVQLASAGDVDGFLTLGRLPVAAVGGGASTAVDGFVTLPADLVDGRYVVTLRLDPEGLVDDPVREDDVLTLPLEVSAALACTPDALEPNRSPGEASPGRSAPVEEGSFVNLRVCGSDDDWYAVTLEAGDGVAVRVAFEHDDGDIDLELYDADGTTELDSSAGATDEESVELARSAAGGVYYVRVLLFGDRAPSTTYDLEVDVRRAGECADDAFSPNGTSETAAVVADGDYVLNLCAGTEDWYVFSMAVGNAVSFRAQSDAAISLRLFSPDGEVLDEDDTSVGWDAEEAGDYRLQVSTEVAGAVAYSLRVRGASGFDLEVSNTAVVPEVVEAAGEVRWRFDARNLLGDRIEGATARVLVSRDALPSQDDAVLASPGLARLEGVDAVTTSGRARLPRGLQAGSWFLVVELDPAQVVADPRRGNNVQAVPFTVRAACVDDDPRANEGPLGATPLEGSSGLLEGGVVCAFTEDWFTLTAARAGEVEFTLSFDGAAGDLDLEVYAADGVTLLAESRTEADEERVVFDLDAPGEVLVRVDGFVDAANTYDLAWSLP